MKPLFTTMVGAMALVAGVAAAPVFAGDAHVTFVPEEIEWSAGPPALPAGAEAAVLFGDPAAEGPFALRLKFPDGYHIPAHTHPAQENVTVISGTFLLGMGEDEDEETAMPLGAGGFVSLPPGMVHHGYASGETIVQLNAIGPWGLTYIDPADDPRKTQ